MSKCTVCTLVVTVQSLIEHAPVERVAAHVCWQVTKDVCECSGADHEAKKQIVLLRIPPNSQGIQPTAVTVLTSEGCSVDICLESPWVFRVKVMAVNARHHHRRLIPLQATGRAAQVQIDAEPGGTDYTHVILTVHPIGQHFLSAA